MDYNIILGKSTLTNVSDAYSGTLNVTYSQYTNNGVYLCKIDTTNTTISPTLSLNGLTAYPIKRNDGTSILVGELKVDAWYLFMFDQSTSTFEILNLSIPYLNGTTNYVAKYTPTGNVLGLSQIFDNGTNVGIGTSFPTSKLQIVGIDSTSSNYSLKIDNSASSPLFYVRNDGNIDIGDINSYGGTSLSYIKNSGFNGAFYINGNIGNGLNNGKQVYINSEFVRLGTQSQSVFGQGTTYIEMQVFDDSSNLKINKSTYDLYSNYTSLGVAYKEGSGAVISATVSSFIYNRILNFNDINNRTLNGININTSLGSWNNIGVGKSTNIGLNVLVGNADINYAAILNGGNVGIGTSTPTEKLEVNGNIKTAQPSANGAGAWKLGKKVTATVSLVTTDYIEVEIDSVVYKLALVS